MPLDTHIWFWWVSAPELLAHRHRAFLESSNQALKVSIISLWEIATLVSKGRLALPTEIEEWFEFALESTRLPGTFHRDPTDQIIVATSRVLSLPLVTIDRRILAYEHVQLAATDDR